MTSDPPSPKAPVALLGPQRFSPTVRDTLQELRVDGPVACITAGWEERELEDEELSEHLGYEARNLRLFWRTEEVFQRDPQLKESLLARHDKLRGLQKRHRLRLSHALEAARSLMREEGNDDLLEPERVSAIEQIQELDRHHVGRVQEIHQQFSESLSAGQHGSVQQEREDLARSMDGVGALLIAGGHVVVLLNRLRLFDVLGLASDLPIVAWSAGAMALSERIVLFHDRPPQGAGDPEILETGLGLCPGIVPLPHAQKRLQLDDPIRVSLFARRFAPAQCITLDNESKLCWNGQDWVASPQTKKLNHDGQVQEFAP